MRIVVLHGPGSRADGPEALVQEWRRALLSGLEAAGLDKADIDVRFVSYGVPAKLVGEGASLDADLETYFGDPDIRERALDAVRTAVAGAGSPVLLVGHGMGSVIAYDLLATDGAETLGVEALLTLGSPLAVQNVRRLVEWVQPRTPFPTGLHRWVDASKEPAGAQESELAKLYRAHDGRAIEPAYAPGSANEPTAILASAEIGKAILDLLSGVADGRELEIEPSPRDHRGEPVRSTASRPAAASPPIAAALSPPPAPARSGAPSAPPAPPPSGKHVVERTASADFPPAVTPGSTHELLVAIAGIAVHAGGETNLALEVPVDQHEAMIKVGVYAADFEVRAVDDPRRTWSEVRVDLEDPDHVAEARFKLTARDGGDERECPIYVTFYRGNLPVGQLSLVCLIDPRQEVRRASISMTIGGASDPEYVLVVTDRSQGPKGAGPFDIFVSKEGEYLNKPLGSFPVAIDAWEYASARLDGFRRVREEPTTEDRIRAAEALGLELWRDLPEAFQRFYWDELHEHPGAALAIYSQEPYIPWELIRPQREVGGEEAGFFGATMRIARWKQAVRFPDPLTVTGFSIIAPEYGPESGSRPLPGAQLEAQQLIDEFGGERVKGERAVVRDLLESSRGIQLIHFAGHGDFDPGAAEMSVIRLSDASIVPRDLTRAILGRTAHPFVFLNACEVGEQGWALTRIGGWAEAFTDIGFSGFIGPYWAVNDRIARKSAVLFYRSLSAGLTVGEAIRQIRLQFYADPDDAGHPSWLAYTLHCQPNIHIEMPTVDATNVAPATAKSKRRKKGTDR